MTDLDTFRREAREWIAQNYPPALRAPMDLDGDDLPWGGTRTRYNSPDTLVWLQRMAARGWTVPDWPREYGGAGLDGARAGVLREELKAAGCRPAVFSFGLMMLAPVLLEFGSEAQKRLYLPQIARGEIRWCQGYSEPGAGSDLASLKTRAEDMGDHWLVNGQKIWTSYADLADWIFCLVRTESRLEARRHLVPADGHVESWHLDAADPADLGQVEFLPGVFRQRARAEGAAGRRARRRLEDRQAAAAVRAHGHFRRARSRAWAARPRGRSLATLAKQHAGELDGRIASSHLRSLVARHEMQGEALALTLRRVAEESSATGPSAASSVLKAIAAKHNQDKHELMLEIMGQAALGWEGAPFDSEDIDICRHWLRTKANSIEGGTSEIQYNIVAKHVLGLPD